MMPAEEQHGVTMGAAQLLDGEGTEIRNKEDVQGSIALISAEATDGGTPFEPAVGGTDRLNHVIHVNRRVSSIPYGNKSIHKESLTCVHTQQAGHRGVAATLAQFCGYCVWSGVENDAHELVGQCLYCTHSRAS